MRITFEALPQHNDPTVPSKAEVGAMLAEAPGQWAIVARHDRAERATSHRNRVRDGREYGEGFEAEARQIGSEHRVYARKVA